MFTAGQIAVLRLLLNGWNNKTIGDTLGISEDTVKAHMKNAMKAAGVKNRVQMAMFLIRQPDRLGD